ncbi:hypothetical protein OG401_21945 [Kitasatospora purpeofusca]|uniref:hypothetical protein n=1 Tax=Kitasatospora purpeofusca TaxID=67352 RepID=UPI00225955EB|nr:hypothetical protein [Kitasatospora purpeofusca]MCX4686935.1 hypothetical protein [Kitasatospora purpeofusca]
MIVALSTTVLFAIISVVLVRGRRVSMPTALVLWLSGFTAATTGVAGPVNDFLASIVRLVSGH